MEENNYAISRQKRDIEELNVEKVILENIINSVQLSDGTCSKIKQIVKQEIENMISNPRRLLRIALASFFESERMYHEKFRVILQWTSLLII